MIHERKVGKFDLPVRQAEYFCIYEVIVAHVVDFDATIVIFFKELDDIILAIPEQLIEALAWQAHRDHSIRDVAQIEVKLAILVPIPVSRDDPLDNCALSCLCLALLAQIYLLKKVGVGGLAEPI